MRKIFLCINLCMLSYIAATGQQVDRSLTDKIQALINQSGLEEVGVYVHHFAKNTKVEINADTIYPTASVVKIPIMCGLFDKINNGEIDYKTTLTYHDSLTYSKYDIVGCLKEGSEIALGKVILLMESTSDNTASLWCQVLAGGGKDINQWLADNGFKDTRVNSRTPGRQEFQNKYGWGQLTPREMARLLTMIREDKAVSPAASERMYRTLTNIYWDDRSLSQIPPYVQVASKQGFVTRSTTEVVLVNAPHGDYVFCIATNNEPVVDAEVRIGRQLIRDISNLLWNYYEPDYGWEPNKEALEKYMEY
ncbi:MAG: class A beta-lactamase-related serine hydrolase [Prevotellaceae bacterium]|jgi:beta-lactamase class A|nr:class A beta-lactamase-related serine hydrolase [Prevotellaceae bacterium]